MSHFVRKAMNLAHNNPRMIFFDVSFLLKFIITIITLPPVQVARCPLANCCRDPQLTH